MTTLPTLSEAVAAFTDGRHNRALELAQGAADHADPDVARAARVLVISSLLELDRPREAAAWVDESRVGLPDDGELLVLQARCGLALDDVAYAVQALEVLPADPADAVACRVRAEVALCSDAVDDAASWIAQALRAEPADPAAWAAATVVVDRAGQVPQPLFDLLVVHAGSATTISGLVLGHGGGADAMLEALWEEGSRRTAVEAALGFLGPRLPVMRALEWSARLRAAGRLVDCPALGVAANDERHPRERVRAAAAVSRAFADPRAETLLSVATAALRSEDLVDALDELLELDPDLIEVFVLAAASDGGRCVVVAGALADAGVGDFGLVLVRHGLELGASQTALARVAQQSLSPGALDDLAARARATGQRDLLAALGAA